LVSSFAQSAPNKSAAEVGAQLVAERDATWQREHTPAKMVEAPMAHHKLGHVKHAKDHARTKHVKHSRHAKHKIKKTV
jgi:hypothetical protein